MLALFVLLLLMILVFGSLGVFVAKAFLLAALVVFAVSLLTGGVYFRRR